jgi:membrane-associated phospholipid phosphatase
VTTTVPAPAPARARAAEPDLLVRRWVVRVLFLALVAAWVAVVGVPADRVTPLVLAWLAAIAWRWGVPWRRHLDFARDWWPVAATLLFWTYSRGVADNLGTPVHVQMPVSVDSWLGGGELPTLRLQAALCGSSCTDLMAGAWYDTICTVTYATHFVAGLGLAAVLWIRSRRQWATWIRRYLAINLCGLVVYVLYPMAPPWMASDVGATTGHVERLTGRGGSAVGLHIAQLVMGPIGNPVAAMPSLHAGTAALVALFAVSRLRSPWRWAALAYPLLMGFTLVYYGEHYVVDVLAGYLLAAAVHTAFSLWERRSARARQGTRRDNASPGPAYVVSELAVLGDHHDDTARRLGSHELTDDVVGDHAHGAEQHLHTTR